MINENKECNQNNIKASGTFYLVGNLFNKGIAFLTVPIFTRILTTSEYGIVTTYNSWVGILAMVLGLALHMSIRAAFIDYRDKINDFLSTIMFFSLLYSVMVGTIVVSVVLVGKISINIGMVFLCLVQGFFTAIIEDYSVYLMMQYRYKARTLLMILPNLLSALLSIITILFFVKTERYWGRIVPTALIFCVIGLVILTSVFTKSRRIWNFEYLKFGLKVSVPLIMHGLALNILSQSDRTMITWLADASQTGIYSLVYNFSMIATVITSALEGIWVPWFTDLLMRDRRKEINLYAKDYINLMTYLMIGLIMIGPELLKMLSAREYWEGISIIPPIVFTNYIIFSYTLYVNVEHYYKKTIGVSKNTIVAALTNVILNYLFIPYFGYVAAAYTTLASYFLCFILHSRVSQKLEPGLFPLKTFLRPFMHLCMSIFLFYLLEETPIIRWSVVCIYIGLMLFRERERILVYFPEFNKFLVRKK